VVARPLTCLVAGNLLLSSASGCNRDPGVPSEGYHDDFERKALGADWLDTSSGQYRLLRGALHASNAKNHPLWLKRTLPKNVRIEFEAKSLTDEGDIKVEIFGDGKSYAQQASYVASGYVVIFGGWHNQLNVIARRDEHSPARAVGKVQRVVPNHRYQIRIERVEKRVAMWVDGHLLCEFYDETPLEGRGQDHFAFNDWGAAVVFDNLKILPLENRG